MLKREKSHKMTWAMLVPRRGAEFPRIAKASMFIAQLGHARVTLRCDNEPAIEAFGNGTCTSSSRRKPDCARETTSGRGPVQRNHRTHGGTRGQARTLKAAVEHRSGVKVPPDARVLCWLAAYLVNKWRHLQRRKDADRQAAWTRREQSRTPEFVWVRREESQRRGEPHVVRDAQTCVPEQHVPRRISKKTTLPEHQVAVTTLDGFREKAMKAANVKNSALNWVSISSAGAHDMTHCDFSVRSQREETS